MKRIQLKPLALAAAAFAYAAGTIQVATADDTEIYVPKDVPADQQVRPNVLFILDSSGSMTTGVPGTSVQTGSNRYGPTYRQKQRIEVLREVVGDLIDNLKAQGNVNVGFMRYGGQTTTCKNNRCSTSDSIEQGGHVIYPVKHLSGNAEANTMKGIVNAVNTSDWTPLLETYYESYLYLAGKEPHFSGTRNHAGSMKGGSFDSPINHSCQKTHIIYVTDGEPTRDIDAHSMINTLIAGKNTKYTECDTGKKRKDGSCLPHLAEYMANNDIAPRDNNGKKLFPDPTNRKQTVTSHFIGFALDLKLLKDAADAGGGKYYTSDNVSGLVDALQSIIVDITADNTTFVAPSVAVTAYNNFGFRDELYYSLFRPSEGSNWIGNVKKYKLKTQDADGKPITPMIVDRNGTQAIDPETGFFKETSSSLWSTLVDGDDVGKGGFAARLQPGSRKIYTWYGADKNAGDPGSAQPLKLFSSNGTLNTTTTSSSNISNTMLDTNSTDRNKVLSWIRGYKEDNSARFAIGDILHNEPRLVAYTTDENIVRAETSDTKEEVTIFVGTNEGFIHAIDAKTGDEKFAFLPKELLHVPNKYRVDNKGYNNKAYGMDGYFTTLVEYHDRVNDTRKAKKVNLYAGMRRGGSNYYALDVADLNTPKLKWVLKGAYKDNYRDLIQAGNQNSYNNAYRDAAAGMTPGFERLGLTFSAARLSRLKVGGTTKDVLVFTGGYDAKQDEAGYNEPANDDIGNALYIVDAETGALLWRASGTNGRPQTEPAGLHTLNVPEMTNSMPASPTLIDIDNDGLLDIIYTTDLRGQIFRFDVKNGDVGQIAGHLFASLGGDQAADNRRFFNSADVALIRDRGQAPYFTVSVGSGFRESPLNEQTDDRFYMLRDTYVTQSRSALSNPPVFKESNLADVSGLISDQARANEVYAAVADLQAQIDALENNVREQEQSLEDLKLASGYAIEHQRYLDKMNEINNLQLDIDGITRGSYPEFDAANYDQYTRYNPDYLALHAAELREQLLLQQLIGATHDRLAKLVGDEIPDKAVKIAGYYQALLNLQGETLDSANSLVSNENFILRGHANPALTEELKAEINNRFPDSGINFEEQLGDFSDLAHLLDDAIRNEYAKRLYEDAEEATGASDKNRRSYMVSQYYDDLIDLLKDDSSNFLDMSDSGFASSGLEPVAVDNASIEALLALDHTASFAQLQEQADVFISAQNSIDDKAAAIEQAQLAAEAAKEATDLIATDQNFQHWINAIEAAYAATRHPETGIYALRTLINSEFQTLEVDQDEMSDEQKVQVRNSSGFMLRLPRGEKVLADSITYNGGVRFSTFSPRGQAVSDCGSDVGVGRTYGLSLRTGEGIFATQVNGETRYVRSVVNKQAGIPPRPTIILMPRPKDAPPPPPCDDGVCIEYYDPITHKYWRETEANGESE